MSDQPRDELDVAHQIVGPSQYEELLQMVNLGTGFYEDADLDLQMRSFRKGLVADIAFDGALWERAKEETKVKLADEGFEHYNSRTEDVEIFKPWAESDFCEDWEGGRTSGLKARGAKIWKSLAMPEEALSEKQAAAMAEKTGIQSFKPVYWRLLAAFHEATKSRGARTQDNFFGRVKKHLVPEDVDAEESSGGLFGGGF